MRISVLTYSILGYINNNEMRTLGFVRIAVLTLQSWYRQKVKQSNKHKSA